MPLYRYPISDDKSLYVDTEYGSTTISELLEMIETHFMGNISDLSKYTIATESIKVTGCSCHHDASDYKEYIVIYKLSN